MTHGGEVPNMDLLHLLVIVLAPQLCTGENSCSIRSTEGPVVEIGTSFQIYCTFKCKCKGSMYSDHRPTARAHEVFNATTIYMNVANLTGRQTYSCQCDCPGARESCGMDIATGYAPALPRNISCIYKVKTNESGTVLCTWDRGRDTHLTTRSSLRVRTESGDHTSGPVTYSVSRQGLESLSATLDMSHSVQQISVWVESENRLGSAESAPLNYTLRDIVTPTAPDLSRPSCSSRECTVYAEQPVRTQRMEIQYRSEAEAWTSLPASEPLTLAQPISSLQPYRLYHFRARARFSTGMWSQWSADVSSWTQEEAPAREPDVWHAEVDVKSLKVYWKEEDLSTARGKVTRYKVSVHSKDSGPVFSANISADARHYTVPFGPGCGVTVWSCTSKGCSPPARANPDHTEAKPLLVVHKAEGTSAAAIYWRKAETAEQTAGYVVEWYPEGNKLEELQWIRLGSNESHVLLTGLKPVCYAGAVYAVHSDGSVSRTAFTGMATADYVPEAVLPVHEKIEGNSVRVSWGLHTSGQRGGCVTDYTIYLERSGGERKVYNVAASEKTYVIGDLSPAAYTLWMTASTPVRKGPTESRLKAKFTIHQGMHVTIPLVAVLVSLVVLILMCLYQSPAVKQRVKLLLRCLLPDKVPDPANSKWARECVFQPGKMKLHLQTSISTVTAEEDPILVEFEELPQQTPVSTLPEPRPSPTSKPDVVLYPRSTYIKSFSQDSSSSKQTSLDTNASVNYISAHQPERGEDEEEEEEEEEEFPEVISFFPNHNFVTEPLEFGGKLTLDAVKFNCGEFYWNNF